jgi:hypothetical protein
MNGNVTQTKVATVPPAAFFNVMIKL